MSTGVKKCGKCEKSVYPMELIKCLDQNWHKACFKCEVCGMTLNMKNYKGYEKKPYCSAHYPTTKFTAVADTPENRRIADNTKLQSQIKYHEQFEKQKGSKMSVASDPETERIKKNTEIISNVNYQGVRDKRDVMEKRRPSDSDQYDYGLSERGFATVEEPKRTSKRYSASSDYGLSERGFAPVDEPARNSKRASASSDYGLSDMGFSQVENRTSPRASDPPIIRAQPAGGDYIRRISQPGSIFDREPLTEDNTNGGYQPSPYSSRYASHTVYSSGRDPDADPAPRRMGSVHEYDPANDQRGSHGYKNQGPAPNAQQVLPPSQGYQQQRQSSPNAQPGYQAQRLSNSHQPSPNAQQVMPQPPPPQVQQPKQIRYQALYDYQANDDDEISFMEGDTIIEDEVIDEGWMTGTVLRTGAHGMLPANYVERI